MLSIRNLSKTYDNGVKALNSVNLEIEAGMFGLLGPNGAGKSTLMRTIATLQEPDHGQLIFDNKDIIHNPHLLRLNLGYLPQEFGVYPKISAYDLLHHFAVLKGVENKKEREEQIVSLLQQTNLYDVRKKSVGSFSGGMKQRFGIAQALLGDPKLIIVDEPTAGLDPEERNRFHNLLSDIGENIIVILSTHIVEDVSVLCNQLAILINGQVQAKGKPSDLIETLKGKIWRKIIYKNDLARYKEKYNVISARLISGKQQITVHSTERPEDGFDLIQADLEDVYFTTLRKSENAEV
jgi:ABC-2 type transport system ATP-binding protein